MRACGIYCIIVRSGESERYYIGQAVDMRERRSGHFWSLKSGRHKNPALQASFDKHGAEAFQYRVLLVCRRSDLLMYEQSVLDGYVSKFGRRALFNVHLDCVRTRAGVPHSAETRAKQSAAQKGRKPRPGAIETLRRANLGRKLSPEHIALRTERQKGRKWSEDTRIRMRSVMTGKKHTPEARARISEAKKGWKPSAAHCAHLKKIATGRKMSPSNLEKLIAGKLGTKKPAEEIARRQATRAVNAARAKMEQA